MKYIDADKLYEYLEQVNECYPRYEENIVDNAVSNVIGGVKTFITSLQQEQPDVELDKLVNEEFARHSRTTEYGLEVTYNRAELYSFIKKIARKED